jgi:hypothetical protein
MTSGNARERFATIRHRVALATHLRDAATELADLLVRPFQLAGEPLLFGLRHAHARAADQEADEKAHDGKAGHHGEFERAQSCGGFTNPEGGARGLCQIHALVFCKDRTGNPGWLTALAWRPNTDKLKSWGLERERSLWSAT